MTSSLSLVVFHAPDNSGVAIQFIPSYRVLLLPMKYSSYIKVWQSSTNFPSLPKADECRSELSDDDILEFRLLLTEHYLID